MTLENMAGKMALGLTEARCWEGACAPREARMAPVLPGGEGLSGRGVWAEVAAGGDRRALRLYAQADGAATAELQPSSLSIRPAPLDRDAAPWPRPPTWSSSSGSPASCPWVRRGWPQVSQSPPGAVQYCPQPKLPFCPSGQSPRHLGSLPTSPRCLPPSLCPGKDIQ